MPTSPNNPASAVFSTEQSAAIQQIMMQTLDSYFTRPENRPQGPPGPEGPRGPRGQPGPQGPQGPSNGTNGGNPPWRPDEVGFFDPDLDDSEVIGRGNFVYLGNHPYIRDVYVFIDRIKDVARQKGEQMVRDNIQTCLRGTALEWHTSELTDFEKDALRTVDLERGWIKQRFKERAPIAWNRLEKERYTLKDAANGGPPRAYAQAVFRDAKAAGVESVYNQLVAAWTHLHWEFQRDIPAPTSTTTMIDFLDQLESKTDIWKNIALSRLRQQNQNRPGNQNYRVKIFRVSISVVVNIVLTHPPTGISHGNANGIPGSLPDGRIRITIKIKVKVISATISKQGSNSLQTPNGTNTPTMLGSHSK
jgi:hypothetical protein